MKLGQWGLSRRFAPHKDTEHLLSSLISTEQIPKVMNKYLDKKGKETYNNAMKKKCFIKILVLFSLCMCILVINCYSAEQKSSTPEDKTKEILLNTQEKKCSYAAGYDFGMNFLKRYDAIDNDSLIKGIQDALKDKKSMLSDEESLKALQILGTQMKDKLMKEMKEIAEKNKTEGKKFLEENSKKPDVVTTETGLQYKILEEGSGLQPTERDEVVVRYKGTLIDGTVFDSSEKKNKEGTAIFSMEQLIPAWKEALQLMRVDSKWQLFVPSHLAYGKKGAGEAVGPYAVVIFELELVDLKKVDR